MQTSNIRAIDFRHRARLSEHLLGSGADCRWGCGRAELRVVDASVTTGAVGALR